MSSPARLRRSPFAVRIVRRSGGRAAIVYRRRPDPAGRDRLQRLAALSPLALSAASPLLREGLRESGPGAPAANGALPLEPGPFLPLNEDWGARLACFALLSSGLRSADRLLRAADHLRHADANEAAWWLGLLTRPARERALRALRILTEAVE